MDTVLNITVFHILTRLKAVTLKKPVLNTSIGSSRCSSGSETVSTKVGNVS